MRQPSPGANERCELPVSLFGRGRTAASRLGIGLFAAGARVLGASRLAGVGALTLVFAGTLVARRRAFALAVFARAVFLCADGLATTGAALLAGKDHPLAVEGKENQQSD